MSARNGFAIFPVYGQGKLRHIQIAGLHPMNAGVLDLDDQDCVVRGVGDIIYIQRLAIVPRSVRANNG
jgi:hypothetical protein